MLLLSVLDHEGCPCDIYIRAGLFDIDDGLVDAGGVQESSLRLGKQIVVHTDCSRIGQMAYW